MINGSNCTYLLALTFVVMLHINNSAGCPKLLSSPLVTNFGRFGDVEVCPGNGMFVIGMQVKTQRDAPGQEETALNGIAFFCDSPLCGAQSGPPEIRSPTKLTSKVAKWGSWGSIFTCPSYGYVVGFQMRSEKYQFLRDDTASNNLRIVCNDGSGKLTVFEGDGEKLGDWTQPQLCPRGMALTGMQTQVEDGEDQDHTALNRLFAWCTEAPFPC